MSITTEGIEAEKLARPILQKQGFCIQQIDWIGYKNNKWLVFEIKQREFFNPPPFLGTGLDIRQIDLRRKIYNGLLIDTYLIVFEKNTKNIYGQFIFEKLENGKYFDTKNKIRIYPIENFLKLN